MLKLDFVKISPGGNPTILLEKRQVAQRDRAAAAAALMSQLHLGAEQVGFVDCAASPPSLEMMGGEFCLNATRALAYELRRRGALLPLEDTDDLYGLARSSGLTEPVQLRVRAGRRAGAEDALECFISLRLPWSEKTISVPARGLTLIRLPGITHLLVEEKNTPLRTVPDLQKEARAYMRRFGLEKEAACGIIRHRPWNIPEQERARLPLKTQCPGRSITPLVHVAATGSLTAESACGSGSLALALALAGNKEISLPVLQPSGEFLRLHLCGVRPGETSRLAEAGGMVRLIAAGKTLWQPPLA
ncbi:MAG: hypothetical protein LBD82_06320 [Deltaproteobacteria bacterium]|jgi:hypothetical protein|nr:hypothetical protein [Deltaproteobacteria bacterium]